MTDEEFELFLQRSLDEMEEKQSRLEQEYGLGSFERFAVDYEESLLLFCDGESEKVAAKITPIASHVPEKHSLRWAWANEAFPAEVRNAASFTRQLADLTGFDMFNMETIECDEDMAWEINAMACRQAGALGIYRIPHGQINVHVIINEINASG